MSSRKRKTLSAISTPGNENDDSLISPLSSHTRSKDKNVNSNSTTKSGRKQATKKSKINDNNENNDKNYDKYNDINNDNDCDNIVINGNKSVDVDNDKDNDNNISSINNDSANTINSSNNNLLSGQQEMQKIWSEEAHHIIAPVFTSTTTTSHNTNQSNSNNRPSPSNTSSIFTSSSTLPSLFLSSMSASRKKSSISPSIPSSTVTSLPTPITINRITSGPIRIMSSQIEDNGVSPNGRTELQTPRSSFLGRVFTPASISKNAIESSKKSPILFFFGVFIIFSLGALSNQMAKTIYGNMKGVIESRNMRTIENQHRSRLLDALDKEVNMITNDFIFEETQLLKIKQLIVPNDNHDDQLNCVTAECILQRTKELERNISLIRPTLTSLSNYIRDSETKMIESSLFSITNDFTELFRKVSLHDIEDEITNVNATLQRIDVLIKNLK